MKDETTPNDNGETLAERAWAEYAKGTYSTADKKIFIEGFRRGYRSKFDYWRDAELALGKAYLRLRQIIGPLAFQTPEAPSREQVWETTENALRARLR